MVLDAHFQERLQIRGPLDGLHFCVSCQVRSVRIIRGTSFSMSNARSIFPSSSWRPRFPPIYEEIPRYKMMFVRFEYRWGSSPRMWKKPTPCVSSPARAVSLSPNVGSRNESAKHSREGGRVLFHDKSAIIHSERQSANIKEGCRSQAQLWDERTFEFFARLLYLPNLDLVERYTVRVAPTAFAMLEICSCPSGWRDYGLRKSNGYATVSVGFGEGRNWVLFGSQA